MKYLLAFFLLFASIFADIKAEEIVSLTKDKWEVLEYSGIKPNKVDFKNKALLIEIDGSAGPLIYRFEKPILINEIEIDAELMGRLNLNDTQQGSKGNDDFSLRIGLVYAGKKTLGFFKKSFTPQWLRTLFSLAPKNVGISHVEFFIVYQDKRLAQLTRIHPSSKLMTENFVIERPNNGKIKTTIKVPSNKNVLGLWVSSDGDDTKSKHMVKLNKIVLK